jgi:exosortase
MSAAFFLVGMLAYLSYWRFDPVRSARYSLEFAIVSFCCFLFAGFVLMYGMESFRAGLFPLLFLLLSAPLPEFLLDGVIRWLQLGSAEVTTWIFYITRTPVLREGLLFTVPGVTIEIAKECSGIRSTIGLLITCLLAGYLLLRTVPARLALLLAALPVLAVKNGIRIASLTLLSIHVDPGFLFGRLHKDGGFVFFAIGLLILLPVLSWLHKVEDKYLRSGKSGPPAMFGTAHASNGKSR